MTKREATNTEIVLAIFLISSVPKICSVGLLFVLLVKDIIVKGLVYTAQTKSRKTIEKWSNDVKYN